MRRKRTQETETPVAINSWGMAIIPSEDLTPMTLTDLLRQHLPPERSQKSIAMDWLHRLQKAGHTRLRAPSYVESQFSRCIRGVAGAVRFFFAEREYAVALLDAMSVPESARVSILTAADLVLKTNGETPARLVLDATRWSSAPTPKQLFDALRIQVVEPQLVQPAVLLLTDSLYDMLPRSFDGATWLRVEVIDAAEADARVSELSEAGALVMSPISTVAPERWLAADYDANTGVLVLEPADGLARFARDGAISLPTVTHDLAGCVAATDLPTVDVDKLSGVERRRLMVQLRDDDSAEKIAQDPLKRLAIAQALGVSATATPRDRREAELRIATRGLGAPTPPNLDAKAFDKMLERARRRPHPPTIVRVGDELHCLNPAGDQTGLDHRLVRVHRIDPPVPWISRLRAELATWTIGDFEADPFLLDLMERLDPDGRDRLPVLHARAWLSAAGGVAARPAEQVADWRNALRALLSGPIPQAMLSVARDGEDRGERGFFTFESHVRSSDSLPLDPHTERRLRHVPSFSSRVPFGRSAPPSIASNTSNDRWSYQQPSPTRLVLPHDVVAQDQHTLDDQWLDAYEAFQAGARFAGKIANSIYLGPVRDTWPCHDADTLLSIAWLALSASLDHAPAVRSPNGTVLLSLGGGIAAEIGVTSTTNDVGPLRAILSCGLAWSGSSPPRVSLTTPIAAGVDHIDYTVPRGIVLLAEHVRAEIHFTASPLLLGLCPRGSATSAVHVSAVEAARRAAEAEEARRAADDDDD